MALNHGINTKKSDTNFVSVTQGSTGIPFFIGAAPKHTAAASDGDLVIVYSFAEAVEKLGYSENFDVWGLCEAMYGHLRLAAMAPAVFCNIFDPTKHKAAAAAKDYDVEDHCIRLPDFIDDSSLIVKSGETTVPATDYTKSYDGTDLIVALKSTSTYYAATTLNAAGNKADPDAITIEEAEAAIERIEECKTKFGVVPDLIAAPGLSETASMALLMAAKAPSINGLFKGKAVVDLPSDATNGASTPGAVRAKAQALGYTDENMIVCWPMVTVGEKRMHLSTVLVGLIAATDAENGGVPFESPSNKALPITGCVTADGTEVNLSVGQADVVSVGAGVVTALNYDGWRAWGNYTGCHTAGETDVAKVFLCTNRMMDFICNAFVNTFWFYVDRPLTSVLVDAIVNNFNSWLAGLTGEGALLGGEIAYVGDNNPTGELLAGKFRLDARAAAPVPAQRIDFVIEYDAELLVSALNV